MNNNILMKIENLSKDFSSRESIFGKEMQLHAVSNLSLDIYEGEVLAIVGESGCGKTTLGKILVGILEPTRGDIYYRGRKLKEVGKEEFRTYRREVQIIHQDPYAALNPVKTVYQILSGVITANGIARHRNEVREKIDELLTIVGLTPTEEFINKHPHQLSGGQRQRIVIARAIAPNPKLIVADEAVSMIDVSLRIEILNLLLKLKEELNITYFFITHDFGVARFFARNNRIGVMYLGEIVELGNTEDIIRTPLHPYTKALLSAVPVPDPNLTRSRKLLPLKSLDIPNPANIPSGCKFSDRCPYSMDRCYKEKPELIQVDKSRSVSCFLHVKE